MMSNNPIGIFDSGVGGLTVASAIKNILPGENIIYFGDTAHLPYGDKSKETIVSYSLKISEFLLKQNCKAIVIACNTASANAYEEIEKLVNNRALLINVIDPVIEYVVKIKNFKKIGIIGTKSTINSKTFENKIHNIRSDIEIVSMATPLFVPMIEEGFIYDDISNAIIRAYLSKEEFNNIEALILACTHYPIIKNQIAKFFNFKVQIIDSSKIVAQYLQKKLIKNDLCNFVLNGSNEFIHKYYVSDYTPFFSDIAKMFFEEEIILEKINLWNN